MKQFTLPMAERLYLRSAVSDLFAHGQSFMVFPYRVTFRILPADDPQPAQVAIMTIAPKKRFKHAVDRNHIKRLTREAYRLQKLPLIAHCQERGIKLDVAFVYSDNKHITFDDARRRIYKAIMMLINKC